MWAWAGAKRCPSVPRGWVSGSGGLGERQEGKAEGEDRGSTMGKDGLLVCCDMCRLESQSWVWLWMEALLSRALRRVHSNRHNGVLEYLLKDGHREILSSV